MNNLLGSLGLDQVEADPNALPDGKYDGEVLKSEYVLVQRKDTINHVITYKVTDGDHVGAQRQQWYTLGTEPRDAEGNWPESTDAITSYTPTMSDAQKSWYKKLHVDLGIPEQDVPSTPPAALVGKPVTFGIKKNNGYININFVELREVVGGVEGTSETPQALPQSLDPGF